LLLIPAALVRETTDQGETIMRPRKTLVLVHCAVLALSGLGALTGRADTLIRTLAYDLGADAYVQGSAVSFSSPVLLDLVRTDSNRLVTIAMMRTDSGGILPLASKENSAGHGLPTLIVQADPVPEPSPAALAAGGFLLLLFRFSAQWTARR
jgi:hypothetical protein